MYTEDYNKSIAKKIFREVLHDIDNQIEEALEKRYKLELSESANFSLTRARIDEAINSKHSEVFAVCVESLKNELIKLATKDYIKAIEQEEDLDV